MAEEVVSSFPFEEWAYEVKNALEGRGIPAAVGYAGPRAYPVLIDAQDADGAARVMGEIGYFACARGRSSLGSLEWFPVEEGDLEDIKVNLESAVYEVAREFANQSAAMAWSTPTDDEERDDVIVVAEFGDAVGVNGDLKQNLPVIPRGYVESGRGGDIPTVEEEVSIDSVFGAVKRRPEFSKYPAHVVEDLLKQLQAQTFHNARHIYTTVSGSSTFYEKEKTDGGE